MAPRSRGAQGRQRRAQRVIRADDIDAKDRVPAFGARLGQRRIGARRRVIDQYVQPPERRDRRLDRARRLRRVGDIGGDCHRAVRFCQCRNGRLDGSEIAIEQRHARAFREEAARRGDADAAGAARDERDLAREPPACNAGHDRRRFFGAA